jgi:hypothetical protein
MWLADTVSTPVIIGMWVGIITVVVLLTSIIVRITMAWSRMVAQMDHLVDRFSTHLDEEHEDRTGLAAEVGNRFLAVERRIERAERAIDDIRKRMRDGRPA